nr:hypothetical protein Cry52Nrm1_p068 [Cryptomonas curvata]
MLNHNYNLNENKFIFKNRIIKNFNVNSSLISCFFNQNVKNIFIEDFFIENFKKESNNNILGFNNNNERIDFYFAYRLFKLKNIIANKKGLLMQFFTNKFSKKQIFAGIIKIKTDINQKEYNRYLIYLHDYKSQRNFLDITSVIFLIKKINFIKKIKSKQQKYICAIKFDY